MLGFVLGCAGAAGLALLVFGEAALDLATQGSRCLTLGVLLSGLIAFVRLEARGLAAALALGHGAAAIAFSGPPWQQSIATALIGAGACLVALVYDELDRAGVRFGKFLVTGPLLAGVTLAVAPLTEWGVPASETGKALLFQILIGVLAGDGVGFGAELAGLLPRGEHDASRA